MMIRFINNIGLRLRAQKHKNRSLAGEASLQSASSAKDIQTVSAIRQIDADLRAAASAGDLEKVKALHASGADINAAAPDNGETRLSSIGETALICAARSIAHVGSSIFQALRTQEDLNTRENPGYYVNLDSRNRQYDNDLTNQTEKYVEVIQYLLENKANPNARTKSGQTALNYAGLAQHAEAIALLERYGAKLPSPKIDPVWPNYDLKDRFLT